MRRLNNLDSEFRDDLIKSIRETFQSVKQAKISGIYFLFDKAELVYVGQAQDVSARIYTHRIDASKTFDSFAYHKVNKSRLDKIERECIRLTWPTRYNGGYPARDDHVWCSRGIRSSLHELDGTWSVRLEYYDHETGKPVQSTTPSTNFKAANVLRQSLCDEVFSHQRYWLAQMQQHRIRIGLISTPVRAKVHKILKANIVQGVCQ